jgi:diguanylate cyclase (GGDEF)-like protein
MPEMESFHAILFGHSPRPHEFSMSASVARSGASPSLPRIWAAVALAYFAAAYAGLGWTAIEEIGSALWPATGISLAAMFYFGYRAWPGVFIGSLAANLTTPAPLAVDVAIAAGNALEALAALWLFRRALGEVGPFSSLRATAGFIALSALGGPLLSATTGIASLLLFADLAVSAAPGAWLTWWLANVSGALVVTPALLTPLGGDTRWRRREHAAEALALALVTVLCGGVLFLGWGLDAAQHYPLAYLSIPVLVWAALRFGQPGVALAMLTLAGFAVLGTTRGSGAFAHGAPEQHFWLLTGYLVVMSASLLVVTAIARERDRQRQALAEARDALDQRVAERTRELETANRALRDSQASLRHLANHDALTGLPNRLLLEERLNHAIAHARRAQGRLALIFLDLDHFKNVNDSHGHAVGDRLLREAANRLRAAVRDEDTVARLGGDEFVVLIEEVGSTVNAAVVAEKLLAACRVGFVIDHSEFFVGASLGVSLYPDDGGDAITLLSHADAALYRAKSLGRGGFQFYTPALTEAALNRVRLETDLRHALLRNEFELLYQPQVCMNTGAVVGVEALLRWRHPERGLLAPDAFLDTAEECGLIVPLGAWVLREACARMVAWLDAGLALEHIAVNVAGRQLAGDLVAQVDAALAQSGLIASFLHLEISERTLMRELESGGAAIEALRQRGVGLAVDDFGTGYSSLAALRRLPITKLKLDRSFVQDLPKEEDAMAIAAAVVGLAHTLRLITVAEGVETQRQLDALRALGCDEVQGWLTGRPMPADAVATLLTRVPREPGI